MDQHSTDVAFLRRALELARRGPAVDPNPRVGAVIVAPPRHRATRGHVVGEGLHAGAGNPHAEVVALAEAGRQARGATAYVSLEPCRHTGRTGPCTKALIGAGVRRVVFAQPDPDATAGGGAAVLRAAGIEVAGGAEVMDGLLLPEARALTETWAFAVHHQRPRVIWKTATTLDGRSAAADGTSRWITGREARAAVHRLRAECGAILVGTGTAVADQPRLTVRTAEDVETGCQPLRVVLGERDLPSASALATDPQVLHLRHRNPRRALAHLHTLGVRQVLLEGGPTLAAAFLRAGLIDRVVMHLAPRLLGAGPTLPDFGAPTLTAGVRLRLRHVEQLGPDLGLIADVLPTPVPAASIGTEGE